MGEREGVKEGEREKRSNSNVTELGYCHKS